MRTPRFSTPFPIDRRLLPALAAGAVVSNLALVELLASQSTVVFGAWLVALVAGDAYFGVRKRYLARGGIGLQERRRELETDD